MENPIYFEKRLLKPYAVSVKSESLTVGDVYYKVSFADQEMTIPIMLTVIFAGKDLDEGDNGIYYFQDYDSYQEGERYGIDDSLKHAVFYTCGDRELGGVYQFEDALDILLHCSLIRDKKKAQEQQ